MNAKKHHVHEIGNVKSGLQSHVVFQLNYSESEEKRHMSQINSHQDNKRNDLIYVN